ncbi:hypothetical protein BM1_05436 [Bipolaris maydis]|nr:hypothetical protein BM1_05436 [Bipolaris maydis]
MLAKVGLLTVVNPPRLRQYVISSLILIRYGTPHHRSHLTHASRTSMLVQGSHKKASKPDSEMKKPRPEARITPLRMLGRTPKRTTYTVFQSSRNYAVTRNTDGYDMF